MGYAMPMDEINQNVLRMIKASDVGKMLSSADMALLETELETVPAQRVGGWLGEQIAKAAQQQWLKAILLDTHFEETNGVTLRVQAVVGLVQVAK